jgi:hypothetical protein
MQPAMAMSVTRTIMDVLDNASEQKRLRLPAMLESPLIDDPAGPITNQSS